MKQTQNDNLTSDPPSALLQRHARAIGAPRGCGWAAIEAESL
eukprot:COSAG06_NODE_3094_length_5868_cov_3.751777_2_plen_42_part_00